jgi:3-hydroxybutyryl-CoA dehydrogenase
MDASEVKTIGVVGCGQMGAGIAEVFCKAGFQVRVAEATPELLKKGLSAIDKSFSRSVDKGKITPEDKALYLSRLAGVDALAHLADCDLVIEAAAEEIGIKKNIFAELDSCCKPETLLASNTSSLSITEMAAATCRPGQFLGMHFFNPVPVMNLVEIVTGVLTQDETIAAGKALAEKLGKTPVVVRDRPGFIVNLLLIPYLCDAIRWLDSGLAGKEEIDTAVKLGLNNPIGPLALSDLIGLDVVLFIADSLYSEFRESRYAAPPLLRRMVKAGLLGRKTGQGFFTYTKS